MQRYEIIFNLQNKLTFLTKKILGESQIAPTLRQEISNN
jgi:hypothetical protein